MDKTTQQKKSSKNRHMSQRSSCSHTWESKKNATINTKIHIQRTWCSPTKGCVAASVFVNSSIPFLVNFEVIVLLVSTTPLTLTYFLLHLSLCSLISEWRNLRETSHLDSTKCFTVGHFNCSHLLLKRASDDWLRHWSMSTTEGF